MKAPKKNTWNMNKCFMILFFVFFASVSFAQQIISGRVVDENNQQLQGVTIINLNSGKALITAEDGIFHIMAKLGETLEFSFVGYNSQDVKIQKDTFIVARLIVSVLNLDDVVVTGYTSQKIKEITGSVSVVKPKELTDIPDGQVEQMLQGRAAGLTVISSGEPGAPANIRIHGIGNFGDVTPLYIIDGIQGDINSINPYDIESLQVLKDAASYSIYGVRGANGVIVVTTKKGKNSKPKITYDFYTALQQPLKKGLDLLTPQEQADLLWKAFYNSGQTPSDPVFGNGPKPILPDYLFAGPNTNALFEGSPFVADSLYNLDPNKAPVYQIVRFNKTGTDWFHEMFKPAWSQNQTLSVSGGNEKSDYLFSLGYLDQEGTLLNTYLKRFTARINTHVTLFDVIHVGENLQLSYSDNPKSYKYNPGISGLADVNAALGSNPAWPVYDIKGVWDPGPGNNKGPQDNPVGARVLAKNNKAKTWQVFGNAFAEINFLKHFTFRSSFGGRLNYFYNYSFYYGTYDYPNSGSPNSLSESSGYLSSTSFTNSVGFNRIFSGSHSLKIFVGIESINNYNRENGGTTYNLAFTNPNYWLLSNGTIFSGGSNPNYSIASISKIQSFISRLEYGFKDKYFVTGNLRRDGSSVFGPENRYGWFPSIGVAWRVTEESFLNKLNWLTDLKMRGSWGKTGFYGNTDPSNQFTLYGGAPADAFYDINGTGSIQRGFRVVRVGNPKTGWQQDVVTNIGIESILWNGKLGITADWYNKNSKGLLFPIALPDLLGDVIPPNVNVGNITNSGIDLSISSKGSFSKDFKWDMMLTFTQYKNKIVKLNALQSFPDFFGWVNNEVGHPIGSFYGYKITGFFRDSTDVAKSPKQPDASPGRFKYLDADKDNSITDNDRVLFGNPHPKFTLGLNIDLRYKSFDFSTFMYGSFGNQVLNMFKGMDIFTGAGSVNTKTALYDSWTTQHLNAKAPIAENSSNFSNNSTNNSYVLESGTYFRNKSVILGYTFPKYHIGKATFDHLRIYVQVTNLFTITHYSGIDPELPDTGVSPLSSIAMKSTFGIDTGTYPNNQKQFLIGVNLGL